MTVPVIRKRMSKRILRSPPFILLSSRSIGQICYSSVTELSQEILGARRMLEGRGTLDKQDQHIWSLQDLVI